MSENRNALVHAASAYLRSAMHQPVDWNEWGPVAFAKAVAEDKPILLDIGAVWCHWCHVMDRESYEDPALAEVVNKFFIPIKVDRDERPDVDTRYQAAVSSISGEGGWPLTAFLTPQGLPYFGGTYFPPEDRHGRPSLRRVLFTMAEAFQKRRGEVDESAASVLAAIEYNESFSGRGTDPGPDLVARIVASALAQFDPRHGGFGSQPKFPHPGTIDLLLDAAGRNTEGAEACKQAALITLDRMAAGGIYDQLAGGFHRYSVDERWIVPHFEKMSYDNSELLRSYVHALQSFGSAAHARTAREIVSWVDAVLSDRERGGFYASQDADLSLDDDGNYFTWSLAEAETVLTPEELAVTASFYDIGEVGDMHHDPTRNVLHIRQPQATDIDSPLLVEARRKLHAARLTRPTPFVDKTVYTGWNAMMISAFLEAARVLDLPESQSFALKTLDRVLAEAWNPDTGLAHVVAYGDGVQPATRVAGSLDDYAFLGLAALDAWEITGDLLYYTTATALADTAIARFHDPTGGGFFDTEPPVLGTIPLGALATRRKPLQDSPTPAGNPTMATLLLRLYALNGKPNYADLASDTLEAFAGIVEHLGLYAASYGLALRRMLTPPTQVCIVGERQDQAAHTLEAAALAGFAVNKSVIRLAPSQLHTLPPALAETLALLPRSGTSFALVCSGNTCQPLVTSPDQLAALLATKTATIVGNTVGSADS